MKDIVTISIDRDQLKAVDSHPLRKDVGRSGVVRIAVSQFLEKGKSEKVEKNDNSKEE